MTYNTTVNVTSSPGSPYTWNNATFTWGSVSAGTTWAKASPIAWNLSIDEGWTTGESWDQQYMLSPHEGWTMAELRSQVFGHIISEGWHISESWIHIWAEFLNVHEGWATAEMSLKTICPAAHIEGWAMTETSLRSPCKVAAEGWQIEEQREQQYVFNQHEGWTMAELASRLPTKISQDGWQTVDGQPVWDTLKMVFEAWNNTESVTHTWQDFIVFLEGWATSELPGKAVTVPVTEGWQTSEAMVKQAVKEVLEAWDSADGATSQNVFERVFAEVWHMAEQASKDQVSVHSEAWQTVDGYLRNANAVISDLAFAAGDLTVSEFLGMVSTPAGYAPFSTFVPGSFEYQKALIAIVLSGPLTSGRPNINQWQLTVDVPNQTDGGTAVLAAGNSIFVPFNVRFYNSPNVVCQLWGGSKGNIVVNDITNKGFYVQVDNAQGSPIAADIIWSTIGY